MRKLGTKVRPTFPEDHEVCTSCFKSVSDMMDEVFITEDGRILCSCECVKNAIRVPVFVEDFD